MNTKRLSLVAGLFFFGGVVAADAQAMNCPVGTYQWNDSWGNRTCRSFSTQQDVITEANPVTGRPNGSMPSVDQWGNQTSEGTGTTAGTTYYDTTNGCPIGTHRWTDNWGNPVCQAN